VFGTADGSLAEADQRPRHNGVSWLAGVREWVLDAILASAFVLFVSKMSG